jgi:hypothetical protein
VVRDSYLQLACTADRICGPAVQAAKGGKLRGRVILKSPAVPVIGDGKYGPFYGSMDQSM